MNTITRLVRQGRRRSWPWTDWALAGALVLLAGCATVPEAIRRPPPGDLQPDEVRAAATPQDYLGATVRWGGTIAAVRNLAQETEIEIVARRLDGQGRPQGDDTSRGRFLVRVSGFLDPAIYAPERELTVRGRLEGVLQRPIGEYPYRYPVVRAEQVYLWPPRPTQPAPAPPYYYDPFWYDPWYPWGWPYYRYPFYRPW